MKTILPQTYDAAFTAVTNFSMYGCSGPGDATEEPETGFSTIIFKGNKDPAWFDQTDEYLAKLWPSRFDNFPADDIPEEFQIPSPPVWNADWKGTRRTFLKAQREWQQLSNENKENIRKYFNSLRYQFLHDNLNGTFIDHYINDSYCFIYEYGCRCSHYETSYGTGNFIFSVRNGIGYRVNVGVDLDKVLNVSLPAEDEIAIDLENTQKFEKFFRTLTRNMPDSEEDLDLTFEQWFKLRDLTLIHQQVSPLVESKDWPAANELLSQLKCSFRFTTASTVHQKTFLQYLDKQGVEKLSDELSLVLFNILK